MQELLTVSEVAQLMKVTPQTVLQWIYTKRLKAYKAGGQRRIRSRTVSKRVKGAQAAIVGSVEGADPDQPQARETALSGDSSEHARTTRATYNAHASRTWACRCRLSLGR